MAGLFKKAAEKAPAKAAKPKGVVWVADGRQPQVEGAITQLVQLDAEKSAIDAKMNLHKNIVKNFCDGQLVDTFAQTGMAPDTPMKVQNPAGHSVTYVFQDRSGQYGLKSDQLDALKQLLGDDAVEAMTYEEHSFSLNRVIMALPGVSEVVEKALESALKKLTDDRDGNPILLPQQAEELVDVGVRIALRPGTVDSLAQIAGKDAPKIKAVLDAFGSSTVRYVKP